MTLPGNPRPIQRQPSAQPARRRTTRPIPPHDEVHHQTALPRDQARGHGLHVVEGELDPRVGPVAALAIVVARAAALVFVVLVIAPALLAVVT